MRRIELEGGKEKDTKLRPGAVKRVLCFFFSLPLHSREGYGLRSRSSD